MYKVTFPGLKICKIILITVQKLQTSSNNTIMQYVVLVLCSHTLPIPLYYTEEGGEEWKTVV